MTQSLLVIHIHVYLLQSLNLTLSPVIIFCPLVGFINFEVINKIATTDTGSSFIISITTVHFSMCKVLYNTIGIYMHMLVLKYRIIL